MSAIEILCEVPIDDGEDLVEMQVTCEYEIIREQRDVGIMNNYAELGNVYLPKEWKNNLFAQEWIASSYDWLETKLNEMV